MCALVAGGAGASAADALPAGVTRGASVEGITEYELANGLRVLLLPDASKPTITVNIVYLAGSRQENYGETGMAHLLEHLVSYGSSRHPDAKAEQAARGARRNASTWFDRTNYYETFAATTDNLAWALDLEADRMRTAPLRADILESQMTVVRNEFEAGENNPDRVLSQRLWATAHLWHNYGKATIGARADIEGVPIERLQAYYDAYYHPNNAVLIVAGQFNEAEAVRLVAEKFLPVPRSPRPIPQTYTAEPVSDGERTVELRRVGDTQLIAVGFRTPPAAHRDNAALALLARILATSPSGRLDRALVETGKAAAVASRLLALREGGMLTLHATLRQEQSLAEAKDGLLAILEGFAAQPVTSAELERARQHWVRDFTLMISDPERVSATLMEKVASSDWRMLFLERDWIRAATVEDVQRVATAYLLRSNRTVATFIPEDTPVRAEIPVAPDLAGLLRDYRGDPNATAGEAFDPTPANIDARAIRRTLPGGIKLVLLPKRVRGGTVNGVVRLHWGTVESLHGRQGDAEVARELLRRGTRARSRTEIEDELGRLQARLGIDGAVDYLDASFATVREHVPALLALLTEILREPAFAEAEFMQWRQARLAELETARGDPQAIASREAWRHLAGYPSDDPRAVVSLEESVARIQAASVDGARRFHAEFFGASHAEVVLVGDFDPAGAEALVATQLGDWRSPAPYAALPRPYQPVEAVDLAFPTPDRANAFYFAAVPVECSEEDADYPALLLGGYLLGGHAKSRFYERIRGRDGLSYGVSARLHVEPRDRDGTFTMNAITNPANLARVEAAFREELARALADGFPAAEFGDAQSGLLRSAQMARAQDSVLAGQLRKQAEFGRTTAFAADLERRIAALTSDDVVAALRRHLVAERISRFKAGDIEKASGGT